MRKIQLHKKTWLYNLFTFDPPIPMFGPYLKKNLFFFKLSKSLHLNMGNVDESTNIKYFLSFSYSQKWLKYRNWLLRIPYCESNILKLPNHLDSDFLSNITESIFAGPTVKSTCHTNLLNNVKMKRSFINGRKDKQLEKFLKRIQSTIFLWILLHICKNQP